MSRIASKLAVAAILGATALPQIATAEVVILDRPRPFATSVADGMTPTRLPSRRIDAVSALYGIYPTPIGPVPVRYGDGPAPAVGCTIERSDTITSKGWRRIVTQRICDRR